MHLYHVYFISLVLKLLFLHLASVDGAGVTTHLTFLARVTPEQLNDYYPWLKAGAFFPDALYSCKPNKKWHKFAEATHWPPFLMEAVKFWHERYGNTTSEENSEDSVRFQAFLIGVFSHQVVDASWHSLVKNYESHGLLRVLAETEFDGHIEDAHNFIDVMGEFIGLSNVIRDITDGTWLYYTNSNWSLPKEQDIMGLLSRQGLGEHQITFEDLNLCVMRGLSASISEVYTITRRRHEILNLAYGISPRARDFMQEYWLGGEFDLISMLKRCLPIFTSLFNDDGEKENILTQLQLCGNLPPVSGVNSISSKVLSFHRSEDGVCITPMLPLSNFGSSLALGQFKSDGMRYLAVGAPLENSMGSVYITPIDKHYGELSPLYSLAPFTAMRGARVHRFALNNVDYLVVSEPGLNSLNFYQNDRILLTLQDNLTEDAFQLQVSCIRDIDGDGIPDLLLSGASYGKNETGCVIIVPGANIQSYLTDLKQPNQVDISSLSTINLRGGPFSRPFQHFGAAVEASHVWNEKGLLYVSCQSLGAVFAYSLRNLQSTSLPKYIVLEKSIILPDDDAPLKLEVVSSKVHGMFGKVLKSWTCNDINYLAISQHLFNKVFIYKEKDGFLDFYLSLQLNVQMGSVPFSVGFGTAIEYDLQSKAVYISSPGSFEGKGAIWKVTMKEIVQTVEFWKLDTLSVSTLKHLYLINPQNNDKGVSNFGKTLKIGPNGRLIIGIPQYGYGKLKGDQLTGAVLLS